MPEVRFDIESDHLAVLDGYCQATGKSRVDVVRDLLKKWSDDQVHVATVVLRMARINPLEPESGRK